MKKNDLVKLTEDYKPAWMGKPISAGTELQVCKVPRNGDKVYCYGDATYGGITLFPVSVLEKVEVERVMPKVGDIFSCSWGYGQTNVDFYKVTRVMKKQIEVRPIAEYRKYSEGGMSGSTMPKPNEFVGVPQRFKVNFTPKGTPTFKPASYSTARPTTADSVHFFSEWH